MLDEQQSLTLEGAPLAAPPAAPVPVEVSFVVPGEPVPKARARFATRGRGGKALKVPRAYTPKATEEYEARVRLVAQSARPTGWPMRCKYIVRIDVYRTVERGDWDNYAKIFCDAVNPRRAKGGKKPRPAIPGVLWSDDGRGRSGHVELHEVESRPRMEVRVTAVPVRCKLKGCGHQETLFPDDDRCEGCAAKAAARRA